MNTYRNCMLLIRKIEKEYKFNIIDTERKQYKPKMNGQQESVEGTHMSEKLKKWQEAANEALDNNRQFSSMTKLQTHIQNGNDAVFPGGANDMDITQMYSHFSERMRSSLNQKYYKPRPDPKYYEPVVYTPDFKKSQKDRIACLVEMGKYIMCLEEYSVLHASFTRFRQDMNKHAVSEQHEEEKDDKEKDDKEEDTTDGEWERFGGDDRHTDSGLRHAQMKGMLCSLKFL